MVDDYTLDETSIARLQEVVDDSERRIRHGNWYPRRVPMPGGGLPPAWQYFKVTALPSSDSYYTGDVVLPINSDVTIVSGMRGIAANGGTLRVGTRYPARITGQLDANGVGIFSVSDFAIVPTLISLNDSSFGEAIDGQAIPINGATALTIPSAAIWLVGGFCEFDELIANRYAGGFLQHNETGTVLGAAFGPAVDATPAFGNAFCLSGAELFAANDSISLICRTNGTISYGLRRLWALKYA
jgi:hypothetical protein